MEIDWRSDVLLEITDDCLNCIRRVERNKDFEPAKRDECTKHNWPQAIESQKTTCGEYSISEFYYDRCSTRMVNHNTTASDWKACANDNTCARNCVRNYVNSDRIVDCGRGRLEARLCVDYGITHAFGENACALREGNPDIGQYATWMRNQCRVIDPRKPKPQTTTTAPTIPLAQIIVPIIVSTIITVIIIIGIVWYIQRRRKRMETQKGISMEERNVNSYGSEPDRHQGAINFLPAFGVNQCSEEIQNMVKEKLISLGDVEVLEEIGRGQFGVIRKAKCFTNVEHTQHRWTAVKIIRNQSTDKYEEEIDSLLREAYIMSQFDHVNVLNLVGVIWENNEPPIIVSPYMGKGSLLDLIKKIGIRFSESDLMNFVVQIAAGLGYLETLKFVHRDIALRNCLVSDLYVVKISDFGLTRDIYENRIYECADIAGKRLPWKWLAPECMKQGLFTHKSDVWSFGVTLWELFTDGCSPYPALGNLSALQDCLETGYRLSKPDKLSQQLYDLMRLMWSADPVNRPSFSELQSEIQLLPSNQAPPAEYSYTMEPRAGNAPPAANCTPPLNRYENRYLQQYVDLPLQPSLEPDIY